MLISIFFALLGDNRFKEIGQFALAFMLGYMVNSESRI